jgi:hypothetical protein
MKFMPCAINFHSMISLPHKLTDRLDDDMFIFQYVDTITNGIINKHLLQLTQKDT